MNLQETIIQLNELKLRGMSSSFEAMTSLFFFFKQKTAYEM